MRKFEISIIPRIILQIYLESYLNEVDHDKDEEELIKNLIDRFDEYNVDLTLILSSAEIRLIYNAYEHALNTRDFVHSFVLERDNETRIN